MIKCFCDRCGVEIRNGFNNPTNHRYLIYMTYDKIYGDFSLSDGDERFHLCDCCTDLLDDFFNKKAIKGLEK